MDRETKSNLAGLAFATTFGLAAGIATYFTSPEEMQGAELIYNSLKMGGLTAIIAGGLGVYVSTFTN